MLSNFLRGQALDALAKATPELIRKAWSELAWQDRQKLTEALELVPRTEAKAPPLRDWDAERVAELEHARKIGPELVGAVVELGDALSGYTEREGVELVDDGDGRVDELKPRASAVLVRSMQTLEDAAKCAPGWMERAHTRLAVGREMRAAYADEPWPASSSSASSDPANEPRPEGAAGPFAASLTDTVFRTRPSLEAARSDASSDHGPGATPPPVVHPGGPGATSSPNELEGGAHGSR